jgi:hypothetical protein
MSDKKSQRCDWSIFHENHWSAIQFILSFRRCISFTPTWTETEWLLVYKWHCVSTYLTETLWIVMTENFCLNHAEMRQIWYKSCNLHLKRKRETIRFEMIQKWKVHVFFLMLTRVL